VRAIVSTSASVHYMRLHHSFTFITKIAFLLQLAFGVGPTEVTSWTYTVSVSGPVPTLTVSLQVPAAVAQQNDVLYRGAPLWVTLTHTDIASGGSITFAPVAAGYTYRRELNAPTGPVVCQLGTWHCSGFSTFVLHGLGVEYA
jgi:hypothetical protein